jgi:uncharacterized protein (TIGR03067 family)
MAVPASVVSSTIEAASLCAAGQAVMPVKVAALAEGASKAMFVSKLKAAFSAVLILGFMATGATSLTYRTAAGQDDKKPTAEKPVAREAKDKPQTLDEKAIQGTWQVVALEDEGEKETAKAVKSTKIRLAFTGNKLVMSGPTPDLLYVSHPANTFVLNEKTTPKQIDITSKGWTEIGIYACEKGQLKICLDRTGKNRPTSFTTEKGSDQYCMTLKKQEVEEGCTAWGEEVDGLQMGLALLPSDTRTVRIGEKVNLAVKLRNVGKADVTIAYGPLHGFPPEVTDAEGADVFVTMPPRMGLVVTPTERVLMPGQTITLYNPQVAVEALDLELQTGPAALVRLPTIRVRPGKYMIAFGGMVHSHPTLTTGAVEFEVKDEVAWGEEVDGLQMGLVLENSHTVRQGEKARFAVRLRNVGKAEATITYRLLEECAPQVTNGGKVSVFMPAPKDYFAVPIKRAIKAGETITLYKPEVAIAPEDPKMDGEMRFETPTICVAPGKYKVAYSHLIQSHPKLATGTVEIEVKGAKESATAWGKEVGGLQAGLGYHPGQKRAYSHGETVTLVVRVRNVGKEKVTFDYIPGYFVDWPPSVSDGEGKTGPQVRVAGKGGDHNGVRVNLAPGKEIELAEVKLELGPESESGNKKENTLYGTGKFQFHYERLMYGSGAVAIASILRAAATGKLELEVKDGPPAPTRQGKPALGREDPPAVP